MVIRDGGVSYRQEAKIEDEEEDENGDDWDTPPIPSGTRYTRYTSVNTSRN
jgi:hypothetical protein